MTKPASAPPADVLYQSLIEAVHCFNVRADAGDKDAADYWRAQVQHYAEALAASAQVRAVEPVAWEMKYPRAMPTIDLIAAPEFVRSEARAQQLAGACQRAYGEPATYRALIVKEDGNG